MVDMIQKDAYGRTEEPHMEILYHFLKTGTFSKPV